MGRLDVKALTLAVARAAAITTLTLRTSRYIPRGIKWFVLFLVALNIHGFPLLWHSRIIIPWFAGILKQKVVKRTRGRDAHLKRLTSISPVGINPLEAVETWKSRAGIADCDYNGHLSNSSYAKNIDYCRLNAAVRFFPGFIGIGGTLPIAGTHHLFLKEIPLNAEYEIHLYLTGWEEQKWIYLTIAFITRGNSKRTKDVRGGHKGLEEKAQVAAKELLKGVPDAAATTSNVDTIGASLVIVPPGAELTNRSPNTSDSSVPSHSYLTTPGPPFASASQSGNQTPSPSSRPSPSEERIKTALKAIRIPEGSTLHAVAVSQYCYKLGRVTIPPRVALIACGFGGDSNRWERLVKIRDAPDAEKKMRQILRGGWRDREVWGNFWDFEEYEDAGRKAGDALKQLRLVMGALGDDSKSGA